MNHTIHIPVTLKPFPVPEKIEVDVRDADIPRGAHFPDRLPITELNGDQLEELAWRFRRDLFNKAGVPLPAEHA